MDDIDFHKKLEELQEYYNNHDDVENGVFLKNKKYWYVWYGSIQYGYINYDSNFGIKDGSCENRITYYDSIVPMKVGLCSTRTVDKSAIASNKENILKIYAKYLKSNNDWRIIRLKNIFPEYCL